MTSRIKFKKILPFYFELEFLWLMWNRYVWEIPCSAVNFFYQRESLMFLRSTAEAEKNWKKKRINLFPTLASAFVCCSIPQGIISQKNIQNLPSMFFCLFSSPRSGMWRKRSCFLAFLSCLFCIFLLRERNCLAFLGGRIRRHSAFNKQGRRERKSKDSCTVFGSRGHKVGIFWCLSIILLSLLCLLFSIFRRKHSCVQFSMQ